MKVGFQKIKQFPKLPQNDTWSIYFSRSCKGQERRKLPPIFCTCMQDPVPASGCHSAVPTHQEGREMQRQTLVSLGQQQGKALSAAALPRSQAASPSCREAHTANPANTLQERNFRVHSLAKSFHHVPGEMSPDSAGTSKHSEGRSAVNSWKVS